MYKYLPTISVIIPAFNEEKNLKILFKSLKNQKYPKSKIEYIVIDDYSTDSTREVAKKFGAKIVMNGTHDIEWGKSLGLKNSKGYFIFFIDADNKLITNNWFREAVNIFNQNPKLTGLQSYKFEYKKSHILVNRYCELFGINDPLAYYLGKRGLLKTIENKWIYPNTLVRDHPKYFEVKFSVNDMPTYGSHGYMIKRESILQTNWKPYLFHLDSTVDLIKKNHNIFGFIKYGIIHDNANNFRHMVKKLKRNIDLYLKYGKRRRYKYNINFARLVLAIFIMITFVAPCIESLYGFYKKRDIAWFLHPILCFVIVFVYAYSVASYIFKLILEKHV
jgi:glycosyltransferase involved in cell wall biosynthesis